VRTRARSLARAEAMNKELEAKLLEAEQVANRARGLAREKGDLEVGGGQFWPCIVLWLTMFLVLWPPMKKKKKQGQLRALALEHDNLRAQFKGKVVDIQGAVNREQEKEVALETAAARYMQQQMLLDELHSRSEELTKHAQAALLKLASINALGDLEAAGSAIGRLDRESEVYRAELEANLDLNPALAELMFARHLMNKLESHVFALKEEGAMKAAEYAAAHHDVTATREEMEDLRESHEGVVTKMKMLQDRAKIINESLQEKVNQLIRGVLPSFLCHCVLPLLSCTRHRLTIQMRTQKARALEEATAAIDELEAKAERLARSLDMEKKSHTTTKLERDEVRDFFEVLELF
jgi:hypothetical protein